MFNKIVRKISLIKIIDELVLPFFILLAARYLGIFIASFLLPVGFTVSFKASLISAPFIQFASETHLLLANSIAWIFTGIVLAVVFGYVAHRILHFHEDWLHPKQAATLHDRKLDHLIINSHEALHQGVAWAVAAGAVLIATTREFIAGDLSTIAFGVIISIAATLLILFVFAVLEDHKLDGKKV